MSIAKLYLERKSNKLKKLLRIPDLKKLKYEQTLHEIKPKRPTRRFKRSLTQNVSITEANVVVNLSSTELTQYEWSAEVDILMTTSHFTED